MPLAMLQYPIIARISLPTPFHCQPARCAAQGKTIEAALAEFKDGSKQVMSAEEGMGMAEMMGGVAWPPPIR